MDKMYIKDSIEELAGFFDPGASLVTFGNSNIPHELSLIHELAHKELCEASTVGNFMSIASALKSHKHAQGVLEGVLSYCWTVHEGYAVLLQAISAVIMEDYSLEKMLASMPRTYTNAYNAFGIDVAGIYSRKDALIKKIPITNEIYSDFTLDKKRLLEYYVLLDAVKLAGFSIARAAMSIPLSQAISKNGFFSPLIAKEIGLYAPDLRLRKISENNNEKIVELSHGMLVDSFNIDTKLNEDRLIKKSEFIKLETTLCEKICSDHDLPYESHYDGKLSKLLNESHLSKSIIILDNTLSDPEIHDPQDTINKFVSVENETPIWFNNPNELIKLADGIYTIYTRDIIVVAELSPLSKNEFRMVYLHGYTTANSFKGIYKTHQTSFSNSSALSTLLNSNIETMVRVFFWQTSIKEQDIVKLHKIIPNSHWVLLRGELNAELDSLVNPPYYIQHVPHIGPLIRVNIRKQCHIPPTRRISPDSENPILNVNYGLDEKVMLSYLNGLSPSVCLSTLNFLQYDLVHDPTQEEICLADTLHSGLFQRVSNQTFTTPFYDELKTAYFKPTQ